MKIDDRTEKDGSDRAIAQIGQVKNKLVSLMRELSKGRFFPQRGFLDDYAKIQCAYGRPNGVLEGLLDLYVRMLGQLARQMKSVALPDLISCHIELTHWREDDDLLDERQYHEIFRKLEGCIETLHTERFFRMPDEPPPIYPPAPEDCFPDTIEAGRALGEVHATFDALASFAARCAEALRSDSPLGLEALEVLDSHTLKKALLWNSREYCFAWDTELNPKEALQEQQDFGEACEKKRTLEGAVYTLLDEAVAFAARHCPARSLECTELRKALHSHAVFYDFAVRLKKLLVDLWQASLAKPTVVVVNGHAGGSPAVRGRPTPEEHARQVTKGIAYRNTHPETSYLAVARHVLAEWQIRVDAKLDKPGYANDEKGAKQLAGQIARHMAKIGGSGIS